MLLIMFMVNLCIMGVSMKIERSGHNFKYFYSKIFVFTPSHYSQIIGITCFLDEAAGNYTNHL